MKTIKNKPIKVLVVGQIPPPYNGQAMMIQRLVNADLQDVSIYHIKMSFSDSLQSIGQFGFKKVFHVFEIAFQMLSARFGKGVTVLYYPPAGPNRNPILRDILLLFFTRFLFKKVIYHFRAAGISEYLAQKSRIFQKLAKMVYGTPDLAIQLSALNPSDGEYFKAKNVEIVPNGLEDIGKDFLSETRDWTQPAKILFVGLLREDKGVSVLVEAAKLLKEQGLRFEVNFLGEFENASYKEDVLAYVRTHQLEEYVRFNGLKIGKNKWKYFKESHIFCFPSFYSSESFGNVVLEAMMFELPVVSTIWRGIPDIVVDGETGLLAPVKDVSATADALSYLLKNPQLAKQMGKKGRERFLSTYTLDKHLRAMEGSIKSVSDRPTHGLNVPSATGKWSVPAHH
jgi:glycosyltransferase involved in cell wall biosynthesis